MQAIQLMQAWKYEQALEVLYPYQDYNTAICLLCLGRNFEAAELLTRLPAPAHYLLTIACHRTGDYDRAARHLDLSFRLDHRMKLRVGHDPEAQDLIRRYDLRRTRL